MLRSRTVPKHLVSKKFVNKNQTSYSEIKVAKTSRLFLLPCVSYCVEMSSALDDNRNIKSQSFT